MQLVLYGSIAWRHPLGFGQVIRWAGAHGWDGVDARGLSLDVAGDLEQRLNAFGYDMLGPRQIRPSARQELRQQLTGAGLDLLGIYCSSPVNLPGEPGRAGRALFREYLELGSDLGAHWIRTINNTTRRPDGPPMDPGEAYARTVEGLREVGTAAGDLGVGLLLENNENTVTPDADALDRLQGDVGDVCRVGITYDAVNAYFQGLDPKSGFHRLRGRIDVLHLKNVRRHRDRQWNYVPRGDFSYEWTGLAGGDLQWPELLGLARAAGFDGPLVYEYVNPFKGMPLAYWDLLPEPGEAAEKEGAYLRDLLARP